MKPRLALAASLLTLAGCAGDSVSPSPVDLQLRLAIVSGNNQTGAPNSELALPLVASVTDARGRGVSGQLVNFRIVSGGGTMFAGAALTDRSGLAKDYWTLGASGTQTVEVRAVDPTSGEKLVFATFTATLASPDADSDGFTVQQGDCNDNNALVFPGASDNPDTSFTDSDCDGIDGKKTVSVFVSKSGADAAQCGEFASPCLSITFGISRAVALTRARVLVAAGTYTEVVSLVNGVMIHGGYSNTFAQRSTENRALLNGSAEYLTTGLHYAVIGDQVTTTAGLDMFLVQGPNPVGQRPDGSGRHTTGILLRNSTAVTISNSRITAGNATAGLAGSNGQSATQTAPSAGQPGGNGNEFTVACDNTSKGLGGDPGGSGNYQGGAGGSGGTMDTDCSFTSSNFDARPGTKGFDAVIHTADYGTGGLGGSGTDVCGVTQNGQDGRVINGVNGSGGSATTVSAGIAATAAGTDGTLGEDGTGGGGGGGSGGCDDGTDAYGAGGGGGGGGGVRATVAGTKGFGGGVAVGIYVIATEATIVNNEFVRGNGGAGGAGGAGGLGQPGSLGGQGGLHPGSATPGNGGNGGHGGHAGAGGGGTGGLSAGILKTGATTTTESGNSFNSGAAGQGGAGGARGDGTFGGTGTNGTLGTSLVVT